MRLRTFLAIGLCLVLSTAHGIENQTDDSLPVSDVRVLIDMSGSMKKNDPDNLRVPALRLLTQLIPEGNRGGVWTFGQYVNMLVPRAEVDTAWKRQAYDAAKGINSKGMRTNIGGALENATWDWKKPDSKVERSIILLTDGLVDISPDSRSNDLERKKILAQTLPRLKQAGVKINTIGLSEEADKSFLHQLSAGTGGWHQNVRSAEQLERIFLRMFEKAVPTETLPMVGNKVRVDSSIRELTLLVFRGETGKPTKIKLPNGQEINQGNTPKNVRWRSEARYDLITMERPPAGEWTVDAEIDPDNRVMVVTDMRVKATKLPNTVLAGDAFPYFISLIQDGKVIDNPLFLDLVNINLERHQDDHMQRRLNIADGGEGIDEHKHDGKYSAKVFLDVPAGDYEYHLKIDGGTFQRAGKQLVRVVDGPVAVSAKKVSDGEPAHYSLNIVPYADLIDPESLEIDANVSKEGVGELAVDIPRVGPTEWRLDMNIKKGDQFHVAVTVKAKTVNGETVAKDMGSYALGEGVAGERIALPPPPTVVDPEPVHEPEAKHEPEVAQEPIPGSDEGDAEEHEHHEVSDADHDMDAKPKVTEKDPHGKDKDSHEVDESVHGDEEEAAQGEEESEEPNWLMVILKVLGLNAVLIGGGVFVWWKWLRTPKESDEEGEGEPAKEAAAKENKEDD